ncbi:neuropeptide-like 1 isoform X2 [Stomoxys calcitrans]|nr:neuropeptide-like 1 isoform X2 [Stomoxys calcitrans]
MQQLKQQRKLFQQQQQPLTVIKLWLLFGLLLNVAQHPRAVKATDDVANVSPCELESIINQLVNPSPQYEMHVSSLRNQLRNILRERQLEEGEEQNLNNDMDYLEEDKRSAVGLVSQGLLNLNNPKRSLATLAKNGQLPTPDPEIVPEDDQRSEDKRNIGSLARSGQLGYGKRNIGTLARDYQLPNGKRNLATMARLGLLGRNEPKRNVAAVARYNSQRMYNNAAEKRNIGALKASPVHGFQQKRAEDESPVYLPASYYVDPFAYYWNYGTYADLDWGDFGRAQKRFLDTSKDPELFGIENSNFLQSLDNAKPSEPQSMSDGVEEMPADNDLDAESATPTISDSDSDTEDAVYAAPSKRHIGAVYRSGFLPSYRALRSPMGSGSGGAVGGGRFSRSGRARQFV